jgi:hypothetical protein
VVASSHFTVRGRQLTEADMIGGQGLSGYAWGENIGWIHFRNAATAYNVLPTAFDSGPSHPTGTLFKFR